ncbi:DNA-binding protein (plasmid) [Xanthomonas albilineans]|uniref:Probable kfra protein n=1 Tax=Xanthomonas albilineans (strain GPE PC73 / CFBP 7063) TaxID=380358 RepID=D6CK68_XANAP|nr:DNA-binding protein [Xanthomonas albilineans]CAZ15857.1 probable kfra protein [Xanthomonas albilineans]
MAITKEQIWTVADQLDSEGVKPTLNAVRKKLGGGSYTTIQDAMADWRKRKLEKAQPVVEPLPPEVAEALGVLAGEIWTVARTAAERGLASERERLVGEFTALQEQAREAIELADQLNEEAEQLRQAVAEGEVAKVERDQIAAEYQAFKTRTAQEIHRASEKAAAKDSEAIEARKSERNALNKAARLEGQVEALQTQLTQLTAAIGSRIAGAQD